MALADDEPLAELRALPGPECDAGCDALALRIRAAGERTPLSRVRILVIPAPDDAKPGELSRPPDIAEEQAWQRSATTDDNGRALVPDVPKGVVHVVVLAEGYGRLDAYVEVPSTSRKPERTYFVQPDAELQYRTVVDQPAPDEASAATSELLSAEEIRTLPGTQGDPLRALQNLPGLARAPASLGLLVVRGAPPSASRVYMGGHAVPRAFHILSLASVFPTEVLDELRFVPGNFDPAYGNATGGVVLIEPRQGRRDGYHGYAEIDIAAAGALVEGPVGKGSFVLAAQRGYADLALAAADATIESVTGRGEGFLRPAYYDYQGMLDYPVAGRGNSVGVRLFGAGDRLRSGGQPGVSEASSFDFRSDFHRADLVFRHIRSPWRIKIIPSVRYELNRYNASTDVQRRIRRDFVVANRAEAIRRLSRGLWLTVGSDVEVRQFWASDETLVAVTDTTRLRENEEANGIQSSIGTYTSFEWKIGTASLRPGARFNAFTSDSQYQFSIDPRAVAHIDVTENWRLHAGLGRYSQARAIDETESVDLIGQGSGLGEGSLFLPPVFSRFDPQVTFIPADRQFTVQQAIHASLGARVELPNETQIGLTGFWREQDDGTPVFVEDSVVTFSAGTRAYGLEFLARKRLTKKLYAWVAYTLMWAEVLFDQTLPSVDLDRRPSDFDQRHNLILLASYELPKNWRIGGRFRVVSGYPYTPVIGSIALQGGNYAAVLGQRNTERLPVFHQLDFRVDKSWIARHAKVTAFVDIQNVYNAQNAEGVVYSPDFREEVGVVGIPIFPTLGVRVDY